MLTDHPVVPERAESDPQAPRHSDRGQHAGGWRTNRFVIGSAKVAVVAVALFWVLVGFSFVRALTASNNLTLGEKAAEWMRDNHMGSILNRVENWWYSSNAPKAGGEPARPIVASTSSTSSAPTTVVEVSAPPHLPAPDAVPVPDGVAPVPNEGQWQPAGPLVGGVQAMYTTQVRPDSVHTSLLAGLAWMDPQLVRFELHPGTTEPGGSWSEASQVPSSEVLSLVAAFNSGFRMQDSRGGFYLDGKTKGTLRDGAASFVIYKDGSATVGMWGRDVTMTPDVVAVRQNLDLIIDNGGGPPNLAGKPAADAAPGVPAQGLDDNANGAWGATLGNKVLVWRSGVCVTATGAIVYGYGDGLGALSLSELMTRAGCVRAMELDINKSWTTFNTYGASSAGDPSSVHGSRLLPEQSKSADRYLGNDARDFIAVFGRDLSGNGSSGSSGNPAATHPANPSTTAPHKPSQPRGSPRSRGR